ncbi:MAG TPA: flagellar protein FlgN [Pseudomonas sp.]|uniref:flagella synthesis protein FlgN n=1 Tax=Pseudomonas sp. TaxID=306 RepID=UPI002CB9A95A|nr:flagellar protein FlgN [Pseudomonas sp.]HTO19617.1 flagellar protein FlgN [Pseudomonas sp.]
MSQKAQLLAMIASDIAADLEAFGQVLPLLDELHERLLAHDGLAIEALNGRLDPWLAAIAERDARRSKILAAFGLAVDAPSMARLLAAYPAPQRDALTRKWQRLGEIAHDCRQRNERNGRLLAMHNEILSQLLTGAGQEATVYGQQGY